jgi:uncharacterized protein YndB with AHSA1/START domain
MYDSYIVIAGEILMEPATDDVAPIEAQVEVPGTPEQIWRSIATGPGLSSWFVPTQIEEHVGGAVVHTHAIGAQTRSVVTGWDPPHRFVYTQDAQELMEATGFANVDPDDVGRKLKIEWLVEPASETTCLVREIVSGFGSGPFWERQAAGMRIGAETCLTGLRLYATNFLGQPSAPARAWAFTQAPLADAWSDLTENLDLAGAEPGAQFVAAAEAPPMTGIVERVSPGAVTLRLERPGPAITNIVAFDMGDKIALMLEAFFYGDAAARLAADTLPVWKRWISARAEALQAG